MLLGLFPREVTSAMKLIQWGGIYVNFFSLILILKKKMQDLFRGLGRRSPPFPYTIVTGLFNSTFLKGTRRVSGSARNDVVGDRSTSLTFSVWQGPCCFFSVNYLKQLHQNRFFSFNWSINLFTATGEICDLWLFV